MTWKVCLPISCIQSIVDSHNTAAEEDGIRPFDEFTMNVMDRAGLSTTMFEDHMEDEILLNKTVVEKGKDFMMSNPMNVIKDDVRRNMVNSLLEESKKDNLNLDLLQSNVQDCFKKFQQEPEPGNRDLQDVPDFQSGVTLPGFFIEAGALFQFTYGLGILSGDDGNGTTTDLIINDFCLGGGPTVGKNHVTE